MEGAEGDAVERERAGKEGAMGWWWWKQGLWMKGMVLEGRGSVEEWMMEWKNGLRRKRGNGRRRGAG